MRKPGTKTNAQIRRMFGLAAPKAKLAGHETKDFIEAQVHAVTLSKKDRISELTFDEANDVIVALGGDPIRLFVGAPARASRSGVTFGTSKRTENYRKQAAGIKTIETDAHLKKIHELAAVRGMSDEGLQSLAGRMNTPWPPQTTEQGNRIVEALKAMNKRDGLVQFPKVRSTTGDQPSPTFRRVA